MRHHHSQRASDGVRLKRPRMIARHHHSQLRGETRPDAVYRVRKPSRHWAVSALDEWRDGQKVRGSRCGYNAGPTRSVAEQRRLPSSASASAQASESTPAQASDSSLCNLESAVLHRTKFATRIDAKILLDLCKYALCATTK